MSWMTEGELLFPDRFAQEVSDKAYGSVFRWSTSKKFIVTKSSDFVYSGSLWPPHVTYAKYGPPPRLHGV